MSYAVEFTVRFGEIDPAGVVYYPRFFNYFHKAFESWFDDALGVPYSVVIGEQNIGFPSVKVETEFRKPLRYGERVRVEIELVDIGKRSITVQYTAIRLPDGEISARAKIKTAVISNDTFKSIPIPDDWIKRFEAFRAGRSM